MTETPNDNPVDPMDDPQRHGQPPTDKDAIDAAERMNDPERPQPGVVDEQPDASGDDPMPELHH